MPPVSVSLAIDRIDCCVNSCSPQVELLLVSKTSGCFCCTQMERLSVMCMQQVHAINFISKYSKLHQFIIGNSVSHVFVTMGTCSFLTLTQKPHYVGMCMDLHTGLVWPKLNVEDHRRWKELCLQLYPKTKQQFDQRRPFRSGTQPRACWWFSLTITLSPGSSG